VPEREGDDPALQMRADLIGHPWAPTLAHVQRLQAPAIDALLQAVIGRPIHAHRATRRRDVAQLLGQREQAQAKSDEHVMLCHRLPLRLVWRPGD
jgi:chorismate-pyruvate lyase